MFVSFCLNFASFLIAIIILSRLSALYVQTLLIMMTSLLGHIIGAYFYSRMHTDSADQYFALASPTFLGLGTNFVKNMVWYIRSLFTGDSLLATFYFFTPFAFLGSMLWYAIYIKLMRKITLSTRPHHFAALILMCWPTFLFFTAGIGKDSLCFFLIPLAFLAYINLESRHGSAVNVLVIIVCFIGMIVIRQYLLMIALASYAMFSLGNQKKTRLTSIVLWTITIIAFLYAAKWVLTTQGNLENLDINSLSNKIKMQQDYQSIGTYFPMPSDNSIARVLLLPYSFIMNLCFPLFYLARNAQGILSSFENLILVYFLIQTYKSRVLVKFLFTKERILKFLFTFFVIGMLFMSAVNTNLGLSTRQKSMYLPGLLVIYCALRYRKKSLQADLHTCG